MHCWGIVLQMSCLYSCELLSLSLSLSQVLSSHPSHSPSLRPLEELSSSPSPVSSTNHSGIKRKELPSCLQYLPPQQPEPFHGSVMLGNQTDNLYCKICQVQCPGAFNLKQHLKGKKHKGKIEEMEHNRKYGGEKANQLQWCELCKVACMNETLLEQHLQGKRHLEKLQELDSLKHGEEIPNQPKWCDLCKLWCMSEYNFKEHIEGQKHVFQLHAFEKEKRTKQIVID